MHSDITGHLLGGFCKGGFTFLRRCKFRYQQACSVVRFVTQLASGISSFQNEKKGEKMEKINDERDCQKPGSQVVWCTLECWQKYTRSEVAFLSFLSFSPKSLKSCKNNLPYLYAVCTPVFFFAVR